MGAPMQAGTIAAGAFKRIIDEKYLGSFDIAELLGAQNQIV